MSKEALSIVLLCSVALAVTAKAYRPAPPPLPAHAELVQLAVRANQA